MEENSKENPPAQDSEDPIETLERGLYGHSESRNQTRRSGLSSQEHDIDSEWKSGENTDMRFTARKKKKISHFAKWLLVVSVVFLIGALAAAAFIVTRGGNVISSSNVDVTIVGPTSVDGGDTLELQIQIANKNNTTLETADLLVEFPEGVRDPENVREEMLRTGESLGNIKPGEIVKTSIKGVVFGEEGEEKELGLSLEYRVAGSNAIFVKESKFVFEVRSTPLSILLDVPKEINAGQDMTITVNVVSNSQEAVENVLLVAEYPFGFSFDTSSPKPSLENRVWELGDIGPSERRTINISGFVEAQDEEERTIRFTGGISDEDEPQEIGTPFVSAEHTLVIKRPFIEVNLSVNGEPDEEIISKSGIPIRGDITWRNNLSDLVEDDVREHFGDKVYKTVIPRNVRVSEAPSHGRPVIVYDLNCAGSKAYLTLAGEVIHRERRISA